MGKGWRELAVFARRDAGEFPELSVEVSLIAVAGVQSHLDQGGGCSAGNLLQGFLETENPAVKLWG
jgi:hypothetical protein